LECLYLQIARLQLRIYYLRCPENETFPLNLAKLYTTATGIINLVSMIDATTNNFATYVPHHVYRMMTLAAAVVLRVLKTTLSDKLQEMESGKAAFFTAITMLRKMSVYNNDMPSRMQGIFSQLWESEKAFKPNEGSSSSTALRIQSRLSMSLLHDTMWWWREEFGGLQDGKIKQSTKGVSQDPAQQIPSLSPLFLYRNTHNP
jgi:transcriptional regulatory protein LEU3